ncbi:MAG TPA: trypsin-like peptidase domain-containing protein [Lacipirellulaceae bacterium]|nr:trypsin-like peptidase domain-containing protein [Lacipirellulaceae bacterium]
MRINLSNPHSAIRYPKSAAVIALIFLLLSAPASSYGAPDPDVLAAEKARIETIERISKPTIAIYSADGNGGGSGVIISADGYALTNFHVAEPTGPAMKVGLSDGRFVDAVLVGLDPGGDVALVKLVSKGEFPAAELGDSDTCRAGQWVYVAGNPFLLAEDFKPTISYGILSGVHRYQFPAGTLLEYTDCLQTDAAINPGNSGGPMFDSAGKLIGINGRGSFEKRGRVNVGVGYAISINQIKRFIGLLKSGRFVDHASLGATVSTDSDGRVVVDDILESSDAARRGLRYGDELFRFAGRDIGTANAFKNILGTFPVGWRVPITYRRDGKEFDIQVRLAAAHREGELEELMQAEKEPQEPKHPDPEKPKPGDAPKPENPGTPEPPRPGEQPKPGAPRRATAKAKRKTALPKDVRKYYEAAPGYANYWFNRYHQQRIWNAYLSHGDFAEVGWNWKIKAKTADGKADIAIDLTEKSGSIVMPEGQSGVEFGPSLVEATGPPRSGGLLAALHLWQRLLLLGPRKFGEVYYLGTMPWKSGDSLAACLVATTAGVEARFYFDTEKSNLIGIELYTTEEDDPCEITFDDIRPVDGRSLPRHWTVRLGTDTFADLNVTSYEFGPPMPADKK